MKWMFKVVMVLAVLWSGYWYVGYKAQKQLFTGLLENSRAMGWDTQSEDLSIIGYPSRFDTTLSAFRFQSPDRRWGWSGESFQIKALSYKPNHIILAWPGQQTIQTPEGDFRLEAELLLASLVVAPENNLPLSRLQIEGENVALSGPSGWAAMITTLNAALYQDENIPTRYRFGVDLLDIAMPNFLGSISVGELGLPANAEQIRLSVRLDFDREIDRTALASRQYPMPIHAIIEPSIIRWGAAELEVEGELSAANNGYIEGQLTFDIRDWQPLFEVFKQLSSLSTSEKLSLKRALDGAFSQEGLKFTVIFENGKTRIGPFTIGPAPVYSR